MGCLRQGWVGCVAGCVLAAFSPDSSLSLNASAGRVWARVGRAVRAIGVERQYRGRRARGKFRRGRGRARGCGAGLWRSPPVRSPSTPDSVTPFGPVGFSAAERRQTIAHVVRRGDTAAEQPLPPLPLPSLV